MILGLFCNLVCNSFQYLNRWLLLNLTCWVNDLYKSHAMGIYNIFSISLFMIWPCINTYVNKSKESVLILHSLYPVICIKLSPWWLTLLLQTVKLPHQSGLYLIINFFYFTFLSKSFTNPSRLYKSLLT